MSVQILKVIFIKCLSLLNQSDFVWFKKSQLRQLMFTLWTVGQIVQSADVPTRALTFITCGGPKVHLLHCEILGCSNLLFTLYVVMGQD